MRLDLPQTACTDEQKHCDEAVETSYGPQYHDRGPNGERGCILKLIYTHISLINHAKFQSQAMITMHSIKLPDVISGYCGQSKRQ